MYLHRLIRLIRSILPKAVTKGFHCSFEKLQAQPSYRSFLRKQLAFFSIPSFSFELHDPRFSKVFSERLLPQLMCAYAIRGEWRGQKLCFGWLFLLKEPISPRAWISDIWVHPAIRGGYVGHLLLQEMLAVIKTYDIENVGLFVDRDNWVATHLYESVGFSEVPLDTTFCFPPCSDACLQMECSISKSNVR